MGIVSVLIPVIVILLASFSKRVIPSLVAGVMAGGIVLAKGNVVTGTVSALKHLVDSVSGTDSVTILLFLFVFGALCEIMKVSGGIKGFVRFSEKYVKTERGALASVWFVSPFTFVDCCFHAIASGTVGKALIKKVDGNPYRLAFVVNVTSCLLIILIPFATTYVGYIVGIISSAFVKSGVDSSAYTAFLVSIPYNFYAIIMAVVTILVIIFGFGFKKINTAVGKKQLQDSEHHGHEAHEQCEFEEKAPPRPLNLILPLAFLIASTFFFFWYTGKGSQVGFGKAIMNADFEQSILFSAAATLVLTSVFYLLQKVPLREIESHFLIGGNEMLPPIVVLILSWSLSSIVQDLGFTAFVRDIIGTNVPGYLLPAGIFLIGCAASYFMGSAWGTWALIMPLAVPLALSAGIHLPLMIGAVLAGGSLGDNASPLGETAILSATVAEVPLMEHVKSQLPYSLSAVAASAVLFVVFGVVER